ncbi:zf-HC2 domain-containing protein [Streptomyces sp. HF10]|uniref:zf-HC2 domain-containing protein n=1 Tax=Streptomyces sp. HF10 TaxID=2692233 RepID=UPI001317B5B7|nr:zf-HC2 domain-containing protein [Streptomyces sp. HF10]QHC31222.1 zf-HC2 domain-containing protein [Streptomyces sp. HF10]
MSGSRQKPVEAHLAEQHLGDRLSALVDGELGHDTRERVLAHLATCARCKAEADAQRALKSKFATAAPPPPSASLLARLQGLPGGGDGPAGPPPGKLFGDGGNGTETRAPGDPGTFGVRRGFSFGYVPARPQGTGPERTGLHEESGFGGPLGEGGFRIHPVGRPDDGRLASRGLRFAFAAAGAVSLAAVALGGVTTAIPGYPAADARGSGSNVIPARTTGTGATTSADSQRRRQGPLTAQGGGAPLGRTAPPTAAVTAPLVPGASDIAAGRPQDTGGRTTGPLIAGVNAVTPLIRPLDKALDLQLGKWPTAPMVPGRLSDDTGPAPAPHNPMRPAAPSTPLASPLAAPATPRRVP